MWIGCDVLKYPIDLTLSRPTFLEYWLSADSFTIFTLRRECESGDLAANSDVYLSF